MYVLKFTGAGQGRKALVAEVVAGELARRLGLRMPDLVTLEVDPAIGRREPDQEVQDLLLRSAGLNLGMDFLPRALGFDPTTFTMDGAEASAVLWFDALVENVDRSWRNPNLVVWHGDVWLIDHGATLYFHYGWARAAEKVGRRLRRRRPRRCAASPTTSRARTPGSPRWSPPSCSTRCWREVPDEWLTEPRFGVPGRRARRPTASTCWPGSPPAPSWLPGVSAMTSFRPEGSGEGSSGLDVYEYALLRAVPRLRRAARCVNVGVVLFCQPRDFLGCAVHVDADRLRGAGPGADPAGVAAAPPRR